MRIRSTKPEFWRSKKIASVSWDARLVLKGLESYVDDNGVGKDDLELIVSDLFSRDALASPRETLARVSEAISELRDAQLVARYTIDGEELLYIVDWMTAQRIDKPAKGRLPRPDGTFDYSETVDQAAVEALFASPREGSRALAPGTGEQGNRGTGNSCASADAEREFAEWYAAYPRKRGKGQAAKAYRVARRKADAAALLDALRRQTPTLVAKGAEYVPYPATWLNGERWLDEPDRTPFAVVTDPAQLPPVEESWMKRR